MGFAFIYATPINQLRDLDAYQWSSLDFHIVLIGLGWMELGCLAGVKTLTCTGGGSSCCCWDRRSVGSVGSTGSVGSRTQLLPRSRAGGVLPASASASAASTAFRFRCRLAGCCCCRREGCPFSRCGAGAGDISGRLGRQLSARLRVEPPECRTYDETCQVKTCRVKTC